MQLKGALGCCKVDPKDVAGGAGFLHSLGATVVILISGEMTRAQEAKAKARAKMRVGAMREAVEWLVENNAPWGNTSAADWKTRFENRAPQVAGESKEIEDSDNPCTAAVELAEKCCVCCPGGEVQGANGGQSSAEDFRFMVSTADQKGFALERACEAGRQLIGEEQRENALALANLAQFPHGRGGIAKAQQGSKSGDCDDDMGIETFSQHTTTMS